MIDGDHVMVNRFIYRTSQPQRGDIVVFRSDGIQDSRVPRNQHRLTRIVGLPGERVSFEPPFVLINGQPLREPPIFTTMAQGQNGYAGYAFFGKFGEATDSVTLGSDEYFVLGDNTRNSMDSRYFGPIPRWSIVGKVWYRYAPPGRKGWVSHYQ